MKVVCVIPARLGSIRFSQKVLHPICGKPLLQWVWEAASAVSLFSEVVVAVDSVELGRCVEKFGGRFAITSATCRSGTERLVELQQRGEIDGEIWVNWQGDEPFIREEMIETLLKTSDDRDVDVWTLKKRIGGDKAKEPSTVKVVTDHRGRALYFSRAMIPYGGEEFYGHVGLYAFRSSALERIAQLEECALERVEKLEQLRFLVHGMRIHVEETEVETIGIDLPEHIKAAEKLLAKNLLSL